MFRRRAAPLIMAAMTIGGMLAVAPVAAAEGEPASTESESTETQSNESEGAVDLPGPIIIDTSDPSVDVDDPELLEEIWAVQENFEPGTTRSADAPITSWPTASAVGSGMSVVFDAGFTPPSNVQTVVMAAAQKWDDALATSPAGPVEIAVAWWDFGNPNILGSAGPTLLRSQPELPTSSYYPVGLANAILGTDIDPSMPEVVVNLNSGANWYVGTSGGPGGGADLYSVVLHEIGHGLGFIGSASDNGHPLSLTDPPFVFDEAVTFNGQPLLALPNANSLLQSGNLRIDVSSALDAHLYAPNSWQEGNSFSHFDEASHPANTPGALMTPALFVGETERSLDAMVLGVMAGMGWPMRVGLVQPGITALAAPQCAISVSWGVDLGQTGLPPDSFRVEAWLGSSLASSTTVSATQTSATLAPLTNGASYTIRVIPHADGVDGPAAAQAFALTVGPCAPAIVAVSGAGLNQTVSWTPPPGGGASSYEVQRSSDGFNWIAVGSTTGLSLTTSVPEGIHQFRVRGVNGYGVGPFAYSIPAGVSAGIVRPVALDGQIGRLYEAYFLREPDAVGFPYWRAERAGGASLASISNVFAASDEFVGTYGQLSDGQFVQLVYQNVLDRPADGGGFAHWTGVLSHGGSRGEVMTGFSESGEYIAKTGTAAPSAPARDQVYRLYAAFFLRIPDALGFNHWSGVRASGASLESIAASFATSNEFVATYGSLTDAQFIHLVYNNVLGRPADGPGFTYWHGQLAAGLDRGAMMVAFSESAEFIIATGTLP